MEFKQWLLTEKFINSMSAKCGYCHDGLHSVDVIINPHHIYRIGQLRQCQCGKSRVWTNSVRNEDKLIDFFEGREREYYNGFCNDRFCGYCFKPIYPLENGVTPPWPDKVRWDRHGCTKCSHNQNILMNGFQEGKENDTMPILNWYKGQLNKLKRLVQEAD